MSLPDGEYDIDLAGLIDHPNRSNVALRFLFLPDSFDLTKPMTMYEVDQEIVVDGDGTLFEGMGQKKTQSQDYYLSIHSENVELKPLHNTIRVNKTRQPDKLRQKIKLWQQQKATADASAEQAERDRVIQEREDAKARAAERKKRIEDEKKLRQQREEERQREAKRWEAERREEEKQREVKRREDEKRAEAKKKADAKRQAAAAKRKHDGEMRQQEVARRKNNPVSSKRPPAPAGDVIISDADFDDLDQPDDEFSDLENQLAEVLNDEKEPTKPVLGLEELDESDFDEVPFGISIEGDTKQARSWAPRASKKPVSLREAIGGDEDISEEE